ncbi:MAG: tRNA (adenosine(37)-N6)-threonylcarbamoyltransferase complex dimerization subunit type 1 TsaB [Candidatus Buchananbacteria bacterium]
MFLIIHTADEKKVFIGLAEKDKLAAKREFTAQYRQAEKLLVEIDKLLASRACKPASLQAIFVVLGPGPFTALRIGVVTANTLAWALKIPVVGIKLDEFKDIDQLIKIGGQKIKRTKIGRTVEPFYGREPNITLKK